MNGLDLAVIGNSNVAALVDRGGRIVWWCVPRLDGDPAFCDLLNGNGGDAGFWSIELDGQVETTQSYRENTAILETRYHDASASRLRVVDFCPRFKQFERRFRPACIVRRVEPLGGPCRVRIRLRPRFRYGAEAPQITQGSNHIRYVGSEQTLRLTTDAPLAHVLEGSWFLLTRPITLLLGLDETVAANLGRTAAEFEERTEDYWRDWVRFLSIPFDYQEATIRAAVTLKLCSFEETGAVVAALTTSVPEAPDTPRNWDYRYCWLRDAYFTVQALNRLGATKTMEDFIGYVANIAAYEADGRLRPLYGLTPESDLGESIVESLPGYRGMGPVRRGNGAAVQVQHDVYGSVVLAATQMFVDRRLPTRGDARLYDILAKLGRNAARYALEPDNGIWEYRGRARVHTHSAIMCWAACDRLRGIASLTGRPGDAARWHEEAERIRTAVLAEAWDERRKSFVDALGGGGNIDASLLTMHEIGFLPASDPRFVATVETVGRELKRGAHLLRYMHEDDFGLPRTAFNICSFWYVGALEALGRREEAREQFAEMLSRRNHVGLMSEDIDIETGELWGNFPQTYSLVGIVNGAMRLSRSWEEGLWRGL